MSYFDNGIHFYYENKSYLLSQNRPFIRYINGNHIERTI